MSVFAQLVLPTTGVRFSVSLVYRGPSVPCDIRATLDVPSDEYSSQIVGHDVSGRMTNEEAESLMGTLVSQLWDEYRTLYS